MKKLLLVLIALFGALPLFAKGYADYLVEAKRYEAQKRWCFALGSYYDALGTDESLEKKKQALEGFKKLKDSIESGNPGFSKASNEFAMHDEWKNLLCDAEKYASSICAGNISLRLEKGDLDYATKTASYEAFVSWEGFSGRFDATVGVVYKGYGQARKSEWNDLPRNWPKHSASYQNNKVYNVNGALVYEERSMISYDEPPSYYNAFFVQTREGAHFSRGERLYDFTLNIVDKNGKELVKPRRCLCDDEKGTVFTGVTPAVMDLIDNGEAFLNPVACYLEYGKYDLSYDKGGGRNFIKPLLEAQIHLDKCVVARFNGSGYVIEDKVYDNYYKAFVLSEKLEKERIAQEKGMQEGQKRLDKIIAKARQVIESGTVLSLPSMQQQAFLIPIEEIYKATSNDAEGFWLTLSCCNEQSKKLGLEPVYDMKIMEDEKSIKIFLKYNDSANGFRFPLKEELDNMKVELRTQINGTIYGSAEYRGDNVTIYGINGTRREAFGFYGFVRSTKDKK